ncbi:hypothetical protein [Actibacterium pelagium]|uniref:Uncharacterized protein n=1 Tax=Actibacterium pelagium TaxID=2029103 RepID=A0A917ABX6_9RHOB|nr:hypothetical protein [Actibacterium pelagium]GGE41429.1 hypothetical protein GCM10011517_06310 [Actibacterium pelagium]
MRTVFLLSAISLMSWTYTASAYIDPVTGSIVLQTLIGGFAALLVGLRNFRQKVFGLFGRASDTEVDGANQK